MVESKNAHLGKWQVRVFSLLWCSYASYYLCRVNFAVAQTEILKDFPSWSDSQIGWIPSVYMIFYALGQFINGQLGERFGARVMITAAMLIAAGSNFLFSFTSSYPVMILLWGLNGYAQSAGWSLLIKVLSNWTQSRRRGILVGLLSTCYQVGHVLSWLLAGALCEYHNWRFAFWVPALLVLPVAAAFAIGIRNDPADVGMGRIRDDVHPTTNPNPGKAAPPAQLKASEILWLTLSNRTLWVLAAGYFCMNAVRYAFMNWAVQYLVQFHGGGIQTSAIKAILFPLAGVLGALFAGWCSDAWFGKRRAPVCALMLFGVALVCVGFVWIPQGSWVAACIMLALVGFLIFGPDMLMSGAASIDVSHPKVAGAATGFIMSLGAAGAIFSGFGVGWLLDMTGKQWSVLFYVLAACSMLSAILMVSIWNARPRGTS